MLVAIGRVNLCISEQCDGAWVDTIDRVVMVTWYTQLQFLAPPASQALPLLVLLFCSV